MACLLPWWGPVFYLLLSIVPANDRRCFICSIFSHWPRPCSAIDGKQILIWLPASLHGCPLVAVIPFLLTRPGVWLFPAGTGSPLTSHGSPRFTHINLEWDDEFCQGMWPLLAAVAVPALYSHSFWLYCLHALVASPPSLTEDRHAPSLQLTLPPHRPHTAQKPQDKQPGSW